MADTGNALIGRLAALMFFIALGAGIYALITRDNLQSAEAHLAGVIHERDALKKELVGTEKTVLASSADLKSCTRELQSVKGRSASQTPQDSRTPKHKPL